MENSDESKDTRKPPQMWLTVLIVLFVIVSLAAIGLGIAACKHSSRFDKFAERMQAPLQGQGFGHPLPPVSLSAFSSIPSTSSAHSAMNASSAHYAMPSFSFAPSSAAPSSAAPWGAAPSSAAPSSVAPSSSAPSMVAPSSAQFSTVSSSPSVEQVWP